MAEADLFPMDPVEVNAGEAEPGDTFSDEIVSTDAANPEGGSPDVDLPEVDLQAQTFPGAALLDTLPSSTAPADDDAPAPLSDGVDDEAQPAASPAVSVDPDHVELPHEKFGQDVDAKAGVRADLIVGADDTSFASDAVAEVIAPDPAGDAAAAIAAALPAPSSAGAIELAPADRSPGASARGGMRGSPTPFGNSQGANANSTPVATSVPVEGPVAGVDDAAPAPEDNPEAEQQPRPGAAPDNPGLRRAFSQLGATAAGTAGGQPKLHAQAIVGELAQSAPAASQPGLAQALSALAEAAGKAAPTAPPATVPSAPVVPNVPLGAVPIEIGLKALAGVNHFVIRLDPAELGRIDVNLEIDTDGTIKARLTVDRVETLTLLQRDARTLERAFEQAGLKPSDSGVDLSLRDQGREDRRGPPEGGGRNSAPADGKAGGETETKRPEPTVAQRTIWRGTAGIDVRI